MSQTKAQLVDAVDGSIVAADLASNCVTTAKVADDAITIAKLSTTGTASSSTFLRGDGAFAAAGGGKILQVKQTKLTSAVSISGVTSYTNISGLSVDITPASTSNKILVMVQMNVSTEGEAIFKLQKSTTSATTDIGNSTAGNYTSFTGIFGNTARSGYYDMLDKNFNFLEENLQSTDQHTFKVQWSNITNVNTYLNRTAYSTSNTHYSYSGSSSITVMEIEG
tara:strand:+ start:223 stop:891 length:669 start_codon:yes stop_codon:yes gene_type:complete